MSEIEDMSAVGKIPSGLFIITATQGEGIDGYLGSWIQQASFKPLLLTMAIKSGRPCYDFIQAHGRFCIHVVGQKNNGLMKPFWKGYDPENNPFAGLEHFRSESGNVILKDALAAFECKKVDSYKPGDHELIIAEVQYCHLLNPEDKPLTHVRKSGLDY